MIGSAWKRAIDILNGNWLKIIGIVILINIIKLLIGTFPVQGTFSIQFDPVAMASSGSLLLKSCINSILFFIMIKYITLTKITMKGRLVTSLGYPFMNPRLLYKGFIVLFISNLILYVIWILFVYISVSGLFLYAGGINVRVSAVILAIVLIFTLLFWLFTGISQALYLLHDVPKLSTWRSIKESFSLMKGYRWSLVGLLILTGVGLIIGVLLLFVGAIYALVLYEVIRLGFYYELLQKRRQREWKGKVQGT